MKKNTNMFCSESSFTDRDQDKSWIRNSSLHLSEPNILCGDLEEAELQKAKGRWRKSADVGFHMTELEKNEKNNHAEFYEIENKMTVKKNHYNLYNALTKNSNSVQAEAVLHGREINHIKYCGSLDSSNLTVFQSDDKFLNEHCNELVSSSQDFEEGKNTCTSNENAHETKIFTSIPQTQPKPMADIKSQQLIGFKIANSNNKSVLCDGNLHRNLQKNFENNNLTKSKSLKNFSELSDMQIIVNVSSKVDVNDKRRLNNSSEIFNETDDASKKAKNEKLKLHHKANSGQTPFLSFVSLFHLPKSPSRGDDQSKNNESKFNGSQDSCTLHQQQYFKTNLLTCCPFSFQRIKGVLSGISAETEVRNSEESNLRIIVKPPESKNAECFSQRRQSPSGRFNSSEEISIGSIDLKGNSIEGNDVSPTNSFNRSGCEPADEKFKKPDPTVFPAESRFQSDAPVPAVFSNSLKKFRLLNDGEVQVFYLNHKRTVANKLFSSKFLGRWETHHVLLNDDCISSKMPRGILSTPIPYSAIDDLQAVGRWDRINRFFIRLVMAEASIVLQVNNSLLRDQWMSSILWKKKIYKHKNILLTSARPEIILKEIKNLVHTSLNCQLQNDSITTSSVEIISKVLRAEEIWNDRQRSEEVISVLEPLIENATLPPEVFHFFSRHCIRHPRSPVVFQIFTGIAHRVLKQTMDFGKAPFKRQFVADYLTALHLQNDGNEAIRKFVKSIHGASSSCPHTRILPNLVAVNIAAVFSHFERRKAMILESGNEKDCPEAIKLLDKQLNCHLILFQAMSEFDDWRPGLAQLLQPIPFPDDALSHDPFVQGLTPVLKAIAIDSRCEAHETLLGIRENKDGWLNVFSPSSAACHDEGILWIQMVKTLVSCCWRRKGFLEKTLDHLGAISLVALRDYTEAQEILCLMLEWRLIPEEDQQVQAVTTLQSTQTGRLKYGELCGKQENLIALQKKEGPKKLSLPIRSTDADVARFLSSSSFGNLEHLSLAFTRVTSECAIYLIRIPTLRKLNLWATQFGDSGVILIAGHLERLQELNLCETPVSDRGILAIAEMKSLKKLNLNSTKLKPITLEVLKRKLPGLQELDVTYTEAW